MWNDVSLGLRGGTAKPCVAGLFTHTNAKQKRRPTAASLSYRRRRTVPSLPFWPPCGVRAFIRTQAQKFIAVFPSSKQAFVFPPCDMERKRSLVAVDPGTHIQCMTPQSTSTSFCLPICGGFGNGFGIWQYLSLLEGVLDVGWDIYQVKHSIPPILP